MDPSSTLAHNLLSLRRKRALTQGGVSRLAGIPRSTIANLESGQGNPSLGNLVKVASALQVSLEELLSPPRPRCLLVKARDVRAVKRSQGAALIHKLLPDALPGMEIDRMEIEAGGRLGGIPHLPGTREYLTGVRGEVTVVVSGERFKVEEGDVLAFPGEQAHSYQNSGRGTAICLSVVVLVNVPA